MKRSCIYPVKGDAAVGDTCRAAREDTDSNHSFAAVRARGQSQHGPKLEMKFCGRGKQRSLCS